MIRVLTEATINKIAAGEVIENPASVVKELVENAMDAGADSIAIEIKGGGLQLIKITDNGSGMSADDALLCFERHATSKIVSIEDLAALTSMGFRGEALASIASIARVDLITALQKGTATHVEIEGGKIRSSSTASRNPGTTIEVRSLFYNVPARKKFQKQASSAAAEIHKLVLTLALAHPEIGFELISNGETALKVATASGAGLMEKLSQRIVDLFQTSFLRANFKISGSERGYALEGVLGTAADHRINRTGQYLFVNRRPIFSPQVSRAIKEGYGQRLNEDRYPIFVVHLTVPPDLIDVNVHPQKREVRFQEGGFIRQFIKTHVQQAFGGAAPLSAPLAASWAEPIPYAFQEAAKTWDVPLTLREQPPEQPVLTSQEQVIGLFAHYLLLDGSTVKGFEPGIVWVDLNQVQQQLIWHCLNQPESELLTQGLLFPLAMELSSAQAHEFPHKKAELSRCGFVMDWSGKQSLLIEAIPPFLDETDVVDAIRLVLESEEDFTKLSEKIARFAVRRKQSFMLQEALALWRKFKRLNSSTSFHQNLDIGLRQSPGIEIVGEGGCIPLILPPSPTTQSRELSRNSNVKVLMKRCTSEAVTWTGVHVIENFFK
ncbi:MAG TPA: DNA mismatch repair endonuclease MutL [Rhabdochlamydiaceae bacterium]|nr:DNA mismatch repair endonuclease MutL [Rhabdochlamydiaceae bacterium]